MNGRALRILCFAILGVSVVISLIYYSSFSKRATVPDVSKPWKSRFSNPVGVVLGRSGFLRIEISGNLNAPARLYYSGTPVDLPSGAINLMIEEPEYWGVTCKLEYEPLAVTSGSLSFRIILGSCPDWTYREPVIGDPEPAGYTGGWVIYYPESNAPYARGGYYQGKRNGDWEYFDQSGRLLRTERWRSGVQIQ
jgi:hypothetical protein